MIRPRVPYASSAAVVSVLVLGCAPSPPELRATGAPGEHLPSLNPAVVTAAVAPPPITGGTLMVSLDGHTAIAADPDRDRVSLVDLDTASVLAVVPLEAGDQPGRVVEDPTGTLHVALRGGGAVVDIARTPVLTVTRRPVCPAPRGLAYDPAGDFIRVVCAGGELVTLPAAGGAPVQVVQLEDDLRDVVVQGGVLRITRFRSAEILTVSGGVEVDSVPVPSPDSTALSGVAWRTVGLSDGSLVMVHQRSEVSALELHPPGGGGDTGVYGVPTPPAGAPASTPACHGTGIVQTTVSLIAPNGSLTDAPSLAGAVLPVDLAITGDGALYAIAAPGNTAVRPDAPDVFEYIARDPQLASDPCPLVEAAYSTHGATPIAVAYTPDGRLVVQTREPALVGFPGDASRMVALGGASVQDTGHTLFHTATPSGLACASCHPEGGDDGRVWNLEFAMGGGGPVSPRRTRALRGGVSDLAPYHWQGELHTFGNLVSEVYNRRMGGRPLAANEITALSGWIDTIPALPHATPEDPASVARGGAIFNDPAVGCTGCHGGTALTNHLVMDVGTGGLYKVPSLRGLSAHAPYFHDGTVASLRDRFGPAGGDAHGHTSQLTALQETDLIAYLTTL